MLTRYWLMVYEALARRRLLSRAPSYIGHAAGQIQARSWRRSNHVVLSAATTEHKARSSASASTRTTMPFGHISSIRPCALRATSLASSPFLSFASSIAGIVLASAFATMRTGVKPSSKPVSACLRHV